jgi:hypothetical protein
MRSRTAADWAKSLDVSRTAIYHRCKLGFFEKNGAHFTPVDPRALEPSYAGRRSCDEDLKQEIAHFREMVSAMLPHDVRT